VRAVWYGGVAVVRAGGGQVTNRVFAVKPNWARQALPVGGRPVLASTTPKPDFPEVCPSPDLLNTRNNGHGSCPWARL